jgi:hypothetical protein
VEPVLDRLEQGVRVVEAVEEVLGGVAQIEGELRQAGR